jgi:hypothetical protein
MAGQIAQSLLCVSLGLVQSGVLHGDGRLIGKGGHGWDIGLGQATAADGQQILYLAADGQRCQDTLSPPSRSAS